MKRYKKRLVLKKEVKEKLQDILIELGGLILFIMFLISLYLI